MYYFLSRTSRAVLAQLASERTLCAFDFDGTLSPIVEHPSQASLGPKTRTLLGRVAALYPSIIISGRSREDVLSRLCGLEVARVIGNHGAETESTTQNPDPHVEQWKASLGRELGTLPGVWVEDKGLSLAVHYRQAHRKADAHRRILAASRDLKRVRVVGGKQLVNLVVDHLPDKGEALAAERDRLGCKWVLYVGDDENDEDAFALKGNIVPVRIGRKQGSRARYYLRAQAEIDKLLELLVQLRPPERRHTIFQ